MALLCRDAVPRLLGVAEQPRDPGVDEIVRAVQIEGLGRVLRFGRFADVRTHWIYVDTVSRPRAWWMQEKWLLEHAAAAQRALQRILMTFLVFRDAQEEKKELHLHCCMFKNF